MVASRLNFFLIGAPKAGTTLLHARLSRHPEVYLSPLKEPNHYATDIQPAQFSKAFMANLPADLDGYLTDLPLKPRQVSFVQDGAQYSALFDGANDQHRIVGECSTSYLWSKLAAKNVAQRHPQAKVLAVLRHPVERLHSHWLMARKYGFTRLPLLEAVERDCTHPNPGWGSSELFVEAGLYAAGLKRWLAAFPSDQVRILLSEELSDADTWRNLATWMGVEGPIPEVGTEAGNPAGRARWTRLNSWLTNSGLKPRLSRVVPAAYKSRLSRAWYTREGVDALTEVDRAVLMKHFEADILATQKLLGRDLGHWFAASDHGHF